MNYIICFFLLLVDEKPCVSLIVHLLYGELMLDAFADRQLTFSYNKMCIIIYFLPISSHKMCEASYHYLLFTNI